MHIGQFLLVVVLLLTIAAGEVPKGEKFWSWLTAIIVGVGSVSIGLGVLFGSDADPSLAHQISVCTQILVGAAFGGVYCSLYGSKLHEERRWPLAAGIAAIIISIGWLLTMFMLFHWLDNLGQ